MAFGDPSSGNKSKSAEGILRQIEGLLHQYLDLGDSTPLADEAQSFLTQVQDGIQKVQGESSDQGAVAEPGGSSSPPPDFRSATKAASEVYSRGSEASPSDGESKTPDGAQTQEDEEKRKKGSRPF